ncbi:hypothetical protein AB3X52_16540 [Nocardioides sp. DS6]|uniref:Uncharacterized protein n=1 Tax=Nocardioides eburneus TaxID=3231482 RepID=A0ABV3T1Z8_9ACTN
MRYEWGTGDQLLRDDVTVGTAQKGFWRERATIATGEGTWSFRAQGGKRVLITGPDGAEREGALRTGWFRPVWKVAGAAAAYEVTSPHAFTYRLAVLRGGVEIGRIIAARWWTDRPALELDDRVAGDVPLGDALLLLWVGYVIRLRRSRDAGAVASSSP